MSTAWHGELTRHAVAKIFSGMTFSEGTFEPYLQIIDVKKVQPSKPRNNFVLPSAASEKIRVVVSDGTHYMVAIVGTAIQNAVKDQLVVKDGIQGIGNPVSVANIPQDELSALVAQDEMKSFKMEVDPPALLENPYRNLMSQHSGPVMRNQVDIDSSVVPISLLNPYQNRWTIKARVTNKSDIRTWNNARGSGKLFSIDLLDDKDGEMRATMFNEAADKFWDVLEKDKVYYISKGQVKLANKQYTSHLNGDYELTLNQDAEIVPCKDSGDIKKMKFAFESIDKIARKPKDAIVDVIGVVTNVGALSSILSNKTNREIPKRTITIADESQSSIEVTLWNSHAENHSELDLSNAVIALKSCKVSDYGGCSLNTLSSSHIEVNPDQVEAHKLRGWWDSQGSSLSISSVSGDARSGGSGNENSMQRCFVQMKEETAGMGDQPAYFTVVGTVTNLSYEPERTPWYTACPGPKCGKKVTEDFQGNWKCEKCDKSYPNCEPRYILSFLTSDFSDSVYLRAFNEVAQSILGNHPASELKDLKDNGEDSRIESIFSNCTFKTYQFTIRARMETRQDQQRVAYSVVRCNPVDNVTESANLLQRIREYGL